MKEMVLLKDKKWKRMKSDVINEAERISKETPGAREGLQFEQGLVKNTYFRATEAGWVLVLEED